MNYRETCEYLFAKLASYQAVGKTALNKSLDKTIELAEFLDHPEQKFKSIHIAGTNGKGSSAAMLTSIFMEAGYKVGTYTSPHLTSFTERIKINGIEVSETFVVDFTARIKKFIEQKKPSFFEITTLMSFVYFAENEVDIAVIETGLGGRLDSTNILTPEISLITNISLDHQAMLGDTLEEIAFEKAGIIKPGIPVVISEKQRKAEAVFKDVAQHTQSELIFASETIQLRPVENENHLDSVQIVGEDGTYELGLSGSYQYRNVKGVLAVIKCMSGTWNISYEAIKKGLKNVNSNFGLKGRWHILSDHPKIICDTAHNEAGIQTVFHQLEFYRKKESKLIVVWGMVNDKDYASILRRIPLDNTYMIYCKPAISRALEPEILKEEGDKIGLIGDIIADVREAVTFARQKAKRNDVIFIGGSTFVIAEVLER